MPRYRDLGPTQLLSAIPDPTFRNTGNWTIVADPQALNCKVGQAEVYQISINGPVGTTFKWYRNQALVNDVVQGWNNVYDPQNPIYVRPGDTFFFYWRAPTTRMPVPTAVIWLRYDIDLPENVYQGMGT